MNTLYSFSGRFRTAIPYFSRSELIAEFLLRPRKYNDKLVLQLLGARRANRGNVVLTLILKELDVLRLCCPDIATKLVAG